MLLTVCAALAIKTPAFVAQFRDWGTETLQMIESKYKIPNSKLYLDAYNTESPKTQPSFDWGVGVWLSALNAAVADKKEDPKKLQSYVEGIEGYWTTAPPVAGFDVLPNITNPKDVDRYYDDNEWMVMSLADASVLLNSRSTRDRAQDALTFALSGEDSQLGGGVFWHEQKKESKNTCSNGPAAAGCLAVYGLNHDEALVKRAAAIYKWCKGSLLDPSDNIYWDNIDLNGKVTKWKFTYNTALMLRTASELYRITKDESYANDVRSLAKASVQKWYDPSTGALKDSGRFAHLLIESWLWAAKDVPGTFTSEELEKYATTPLIYAHEHSRLGDLYGPHWDSAPKPNTTNFELLDQACAARAYFVVAKYFDDASKRGK